MGKNTVLATLAFVMILAATVTAADEFSEVEFYKRLAEEQLIQTQDDPEDGEVVEVIYVEEEPESSATLYAVDCEPVTCEPPNAFTVTPHYYHSRNDRSTYQAGGTRMRLSGGRANGFGVTTAYTRRVNDIFSFDVFYHYAFLGMNGGMAIDRTAPAAEDARERSRWNSHVIGLAPEFNLGSFGRMQLNVSQSFDRASGGESLYVNGTRVERRDLDEAGTDVTSLMAWYQKDIELGCSNWKLTPYAGWRSQYLRSKDANDWNAAPGTRRDDSDWVHLASGGFKLGYQTGAVGFNVRGGVSYRTNREDRPGYGTRAVAPGIVHYSHRANLDRTVGTVGAGINYVINRRAILSVGYDGYYGKDTSAHMGTLSFVLPF